MTLHRRTSSRFGATHHRASGQRKPDAKIVKFNKSDCHRAPLRARITQICPALAAAEGVPAPRATGDCWLPLKTIQEKRRLDNCHSKSSAVRPSSRPRSHAAPRDGNWATRLPLDLRYLPFVLQILLRLDCLCPHISYSRPGHACTPTCSSAPPKNLTYRSLSSQS